MLHDTQDAGVVMSPIDHRKLHFRYRTAVNFVRLLILCGRREERERRRLSDWLTGGEWNGGEKVSLVILGVLLLVGGFRNGNGRHKGFVFKEEVVSFPLSSLTFLLFLWCISIMQWNYVISLH